MWMTRLGVSGWSSKSFGPGWVPAIRVRMAPSARASPPILCIKSDAVAVRRRLDIARVARLQDGLGGKDHRAAADEIAEQHAEQERQAGAFQHRAIAVAVSDMADLVRQHAGKLIRILGLVDQSLEDIDAAARQRESIGFVPAHHGRIER